MKVEDLEEGDMVYAAHTIVDDGSLPEGSEGMILAQAGTRGVITRLGHLEDQPERTVLLVRFEDENLNLGVPIGCWLEDLTVNPLTN